MNAIEKEIEITVTFRLTESKIVLLDDILQAKYGSAKSRAAFCTNAVHRAINAVLAGDCMDMDPTGTFVAVTRYAKKYYIERSKMLKGGES